MFWLIKNLFFFGFLAALGVFAYVVPIDGQTLVEHVIELAQENDLKDTLAERFEGGLDGLNVLKDDVQGELKDRLARAEKSASGAAKSTKEAVKRKVGHDEITEADKKSLEKLLQGFE